MFHQIMQILRYIFKTILSTYFFVGGERGMRKPCRLHGSSIKLERYYQLLISAQRFAGKNFHVMKFMEAKSIPSASTYIRF